MSETANLRGPRMDWIKSAVDNMLRALCERAALVRADEDDVGGGDDRPRAALDTHIWCEVKMASKENLIDG